MSATRRKMQWQEGALSTDVGYRVAQAQVATRHLFEEHIGRPLDLRPVEYSLLVLLSVNEEVTPKQLTRTLALSAPNLTLLLDRLQQRGLVQRVRSEADRRSQHVLLTPAGQDLVARSRQQQPKMDNALERNLSMAERLMLLELLQKLAEVGAG